MVTPPEGSGGVGLRAVPVGGEPAIPCGGGVVVGVVDGVRVAAAVASTLPTTISLPAARPSCAAVSRTRSATIVPRAAEDLPRVFDRFYRAAAARSKPGSGLGLAIVREAAEAHGGTASAESTAAGARFKLVLPTTAPA